MTTSKTGIDLIGFPMDLGADRRGVDMGPSALRIACLRERLGQLGYLVSDLGDIPIEIRERLLVDNPRLKYLQEIVRRAEILAGMVEESLAADRLPLCIGGDHSIGLGSIAGVAASCRQRGSTPGVLWIDAHPDMNTESTTPSGNIHGMPLAASLGYGHPGLVNLHVPGAKVAPEHTALIAVRRIDPGERELIRQTGVMVYTMTDIDRRGLAEIIDEVLDILARRVQHLHVSFDLDSVDPEVAVGVGTPVPGGLNYREAHLLMETIAEYGCLASMDIAEVNPIVDSRNQSAVFAVELIASVLGMRIL
ncbi:arginase [Desulfogranum mediterraneum]|uniref:arginase n=1 Tax=Desulfogranum mediterraneum TaxID=160661 RepID=UPI000410908A|nr:arginase [Desulfogranum mediterraneum]